MRSITLNLSIRNLRDANHAANDEHRTAAKADQRGQHCRAGGRNLDEKVLQPALALHVGQGQERGYCPGLFLRAGPHGPGQSHLQMDTHSTALLRQRPEGEMRKINIKKNKKITKKFPIFTQIFKTTIQHNFRSF